MSRISENIRKIIRAWGGTTTGNGISDALSDLYNNLPFGTKTEMVEILPETSVSVRQSGLIYVGGMEDLVVITPNKNYKVIINGKEHIITATVEGNFNKIKHKTNGESEYFSINYNPTTNETSIAWSVDMGCPITVAIYEEQEVVQPIDPKFVGASGGVVTLYKDNGNANYLYSDSERTHMLSANELDEIIKNSNVRVVTNFGKIYFPNKYEYDSEIGSGLFCGETVFYTSEYEFIE